MRVSELAKELGYKAAELVELAKAKGRDFEVVSHLKATNPRLYNRLRKEALKKNGGRK